LSAAGSTRQTALKNPAVGGTLEVLATDPGAVKDLEAFCRATGNELLVSKVEGLVFRFVMSSSGRHRSGLARTAMAASVGQLGWGANVVAIPSAGWFMQLRYDSLSNTSEAATSN
jgi:tRNA 2-thiouridine synthesizing protein A